MTEQEKKEQEEAKTKILKRWHDRPEILDEIKKRMETEQPEDWNLEEESR